MRPCPNVVDCPGTDSPFRNFSSEGPDGLDFLANNWQSILGGTPPLLQSWTSSECGSTYVSMVSQSDADLQALLLALNCLGVGTFYNTEQTACSTCPDGEQYCFSVQAGTFLGENQAAANQLAFNFAQTQANQRLICLGTVPNCLCVGQAYSATLSSPAATDWMLYNGSLPSGLTLTANGTTATISGIPTVPGISTFSVRASTGTGGFVNKTFTFTVLQVATMSLPPYSSGVPYSFQLTAVGGSGNYQWIIQSGSLPSGLTMSASGLITGTPT